MSKAFTKEGDGDAPEELPPVEAWPAGVKNYLTPEGHAALLRDLEAVRAEVARVEPARRARVEQRLQTLLTRLEAAEVVDPARQPREVVRFGATVTIADEAGATRRYRIVGVDEAAPARGWISWRSPVARALVGHGRGDTVEVRMPAGVEAWTVSSIDYS